MKREDIVPAGMSIRLYHLLLDLFEYWGRWKPKVGYPSRSAGLTSGGVVSSTCEDLEDEADHYAMRVASAAWDQLGPAGRIAVEQAMGRLPAVATVREGVLDAAIASLTAKCRAGAIDV